MSEVKVNKISPRTNCGTTQLGDAGDTITVTGDLKSNSLKSASGSTITLGQSGDTIQLGCGASQTGFGRTGTVDWDTTAKTASFTAVSGNGYFVNTTSGAITVTLPATPSAGDIVSVKDYANTWDTNNVTLSRNGSNIGGVAGDAFLTTQGLAVTLVYVDATKGWLVTDSGLQNDAATASYIAATGGTVTCCGDYKIHTFTGPGTFTVTCAGNAAGCNQIEYLVVAGGGGGSGRIGASGLTRAPGGGAGGFRFASSSLAPLCYPAKPLSGSTLTASAQGYPITVGAGGAAGTNGNPGTFSSFSTITSTGGGSERCQPGGSGAGAPGPNGTINTGSGNTPAVSPPQGNDGANVYDSGGASQFGGGGGGATADGTTGPGAPTGGAGAGLPTAFGSNGEPSGCFQYYAGGGAGGGEYMLGASLGGLGGGGDGGGCNPNVCSTAGTANTGGGGGAGGSPANKPGSAGGSGIVVIRYKYQ